MLLAMILALAGCGGGGGTETTSGTNGTETTSGTETTETTSGAEASHSLTKAAFVKKSNAICAKSEEEVAAGVEKLAKENNALERTPLSAKQMEAIAGEVLVPTVRKQLNEIRALGIPSGDEQEVEAIFAAVEEGIKKTEEDPSAFAEGGSGPFVKANKLSREYGLTVCGSEPESEEEEGKSLEEGGKGLGE